MLLTDVLPLDQLRGLPSGQPPHDPGLYFLWSGPQLIYIGMSQHLSARLGRHTDIRDGFLRGKVIPFTKHTFRAIAAAEWQLSRIEAAYISAYRPPCNLKIPPCY